MSDLRLIIDEGGADWHAGRARKCCPYSSSEASDAAKAWLAGWDAEQEKFFREAEATAGPGIAAVIEDLVAEFRRRPGDPSEYILAGWRTSHGLADPAHREIADEWTYSACHLLGFGHTT